MGVILYRGVLGIGCIEYLYLLVCVYCIKIIKCFIEKNFLKIILVSNLKIEYYNDYDI